jgi:hypothetical protein
MGIFRSLTRLSIVRTDVEAARATTGFFTNPLSFAVNELVSSLLILVPFFRPNMRKAAGL